MAMAAGWGLKQFTRNHDFLEAGLQHLEHLRASLSAAVYTTSGLQCRGGETFR